MNKIFMCIDLKSFYASVECVERGLDPITTNLVVADNSRTEKTICLAVTPSLKKYGLSGRSRLFEVVSKIKELNKERIDNIPNHKFNGKSFNELELSDQTKKIDYIIAQPRMALYMKYSTNIYNIYLKYLSLDDIFIYSVDEVFCDITNYLKYYNLNPEELATKIIKDVYDKTGITATAGIGTNLYLAKIAMDIVAKHTSPNKDGVRIAFLDEKKYRKELWNYRPINSFWRVGNGISKKLELHGMYTMGDVALASIKKEDLLFSLFGKNAEILIDHAWGLEPCTIKDIKSYNPKTNSISKGQVLKNPYEYNKTKLIVKEMLDLLILEMVDKSLVTNQIVLTIGYDIDNLKDPYIKSHYHGELMLDKYGRCVPKSSHGTINLKSKTSSSKIIMDEGMRLFERIINPLLLVRRITIAFMNVVPEELVKNVVTYEQMDIFNDYDQIEKQIKKKDEDLKDEKELQHVLLNIKKKYGNNSILKGMNYEKGGTTIERNRQIGGHRA